MICLSKYIKDFPNECLFLEQILREFPRTFLLNLWEKSLEEYLKNSLQKFLDKSSEDSSNNSLNSPSDHPSKELLERILRAFRKEVPT